MADLSLEDRRVLQLVLLQAEVPVEQLASTLGIRPHTFRRAVAKLEERGILLGKRAFINPRILGFLEYHAYLKQYEVAETQRAQFIKQLCSLDGVGYLCELSGDFQYEAHFLMRSVSAFMSFADQLSKQYQLSIEGLCQGYEQEYSGHYYYQSLSASVRPLYTGPAGAKLHIDESDHKILFLIGNTSYESMRRVAQTLGMSATTLSYRVNKLERAGVIAGYYHLCDVKPMSHMPTILLMKTRLLSDQQRKALRHFCVKHPHIAFLDIMIGQWGARALMRAESHQQVLDLVHQMTSTFAPYVESIRVMPQLRFHRFSTYPFANFEAVRSDPFSQD